MEVSTAAATQDPAKSASTDPPTESAAYKEWRQNDLALQTWLAASITKPYQNKILDCRSFHEAWTTIQLYVDVTSRSRIQSFKSQMRGVKKREYYGFTASVMGRFGSNTVPEAEAFLIAFDEMLHRTKNPEVEVDEDEELDDYREDDVIHGNLQEPFVKFVGAVDMNYTPPSTQQTSQVPYSNSTPPPPPSNFHQPKAYVTAPPKQHDTTWYPDSGASHHVTNDPNNFINTQGPPDSNEQLLVGNGAATTATIDLDNNIVNETGSVLSDSPVITDSLGTSILISGIEICLPISRADSSSSNTHQMVTRSKARNSTPKVLKTEIVDLVNNLPRNVTQALACPHWKTAMDAEYHALQQSKT
ncbi:hypothetical protein PIB30_022126 [Stylosanthes scabra]|uniref:Uncharacterized protein n=1 Tax=Stylosanthes scabra TaxID=79078 RepID=A0ABU6TB39_9FABA|nr:hypothetical protein [Stylosanthes scabra]